MYIIFLALCSSSSSPSNGGVIPAGNSVGDTATYTCNTGFELIGQPVATCTLDTGGNSASFVPTQPICRRKCMPEIAMQLLFITLCSTMDFVVCLFFSSVL